MRVNEAEVEEPIPRVLTDERRNKKWVHKEDVIDLIEADRHHRYCEILEWTPSKIEILYNILKNKKLRMKDNFKYIGDTEEQKEKSVNVLRNHYHRKNCRLQYMDAIESLPEKEQEWALNIKSNLFTIDSMLDSMSVVFTWN